MPKAQDLKLMDHLQFGNPSGAAIRGAPEDSCNKARTFLGFRG